MRNKKKGLTKFLLYEEEGSKVLTVISLLLGVISLCVIMFSDMNKAPNLAYKIVFDCGLLIALPIISYLTDAVKRLNHYMFICAVSILSYSISLTSLPGIVLVNVPIVATSLVIMIIFYTYVNIMWFDYMIEDTLASDCNNDTLQGILKLNAKTNITFVVNLIYVIVACIYLYVHPMFGYIYIGKVYMAVLVGICLLLQIARDITNKKLMNEVRNKSEMVM